MLTTDFLEVWAVPGENHIIDTINPISGLTSVFGKDSNTVLAAEPKAVRMTWHAWQAEASARQQTRIEWELTTADKYQEMLEVLPPAFWQDGAFLVGEPSDHHFATGRPRFAAYWERGGRHYAASRPVTLAELRKEIGR